MVVEWWVGHHVTNKSFFLIFGLLIYDWEIMFSLFIGTRKPGNLWLDYQALTCFSFLFLTF
jgi:hypothetical protein